MRIILAILGSIAFLTLKAQTALPVAQQPVRPYSNYTQSINGTLSGPKWQLTPYAALSAGTIFYAGGPAFFPRGANFLSVPVGLQLSRPLNKNVYAFAGISAAPTVFSFNQPYADPGYNSSKPYMPGLRSRVEMGLMYVNDAKTFSISGSIGVERNNYSSNRAYAPPAHPGN
jgi:hypothetical protein